MSDPIKAGDLVRVIRACDCNPQRGLGCHFVVGHISPALNWQCQKCGTKFTDSRPLAFGNVGYGDGYHPVAWLRKVPPLSELNDVKQDEEITA